ncbi:ATP-binding cassette domain-containing protein [Desulfoluna sp.]|uniref:ABC transporter ATP-binding protein n=1 Tax=Desulfoluna sp. TaxID=2045199 RepID=UPI00262CE4F2|nr:ATP-binding cassette domain-containing protein [Desulfoluna sp.]
MIDIKHLAIHLPDFDIPDVSLSIEPGDFFILLGPTGAGKSLILEALAGLIPISSGSLCLHGEEITHLPPERRNLAIVYQDGALFPHLTVEENIGFGLRYAKKKATEPQAIVQDLMDRLGITHLRKRKPKNLSGGEKQRTALARALAVKPDILLLDEPLSALDPTTRKEIADLLKALHKEKKMTCLMVTHDFAEARYLGQSMAVIRDGRIEQSGPVHALFSHPETPFVARFLGTGT